MIRSLFCLLYSAVPSLGVAAFQTTVSNSATRRFHSAGLRTTHEESDIDSRRDFLLQTVSLLSGGVALSGSPDSATAVVGALPEFADSNAILQGVTIKVADQSQQEAMVLFLKDSFDFEVLRRRVQGSIEETWLGYGPEQLRIPDDFTLPVSSFNTYGGHASVRLVYDAKAMVPLYRTGEKAPGENFAFLQVAVPGYRISQMVKHGGNIIDAYGFVNVVSPSGLPMRGIVGITPDPIMFVAINCIDVKASQAFYEKLGFQKQEYPYARPSKGTGPFEPAQPSKSVYMAPSANCMGLLLLPSKKKRLQANPVVQSLNLVYTPSEESDSADTMPTLFDPSGIAVSFQSVPQFELEEKETR